MNISLNILLDFVLHFLYIEIFNEVLVSSSMNVFYVFTKFVISLALFFFKIHGVFMVFECSAAGKLQ